MKGRTIEEKQAETFAYELLMPERMFIREMHKAEEVYGTFETINYLAGIFGVEQDRVLERLKQLKPPTRSRK